MFRFENNVPDVYVQESRDFQLLCRLADLVVQSSRYSINTMVDATSTQFCNDNLLELTKTKVGFFNNRSIDTTALRMILAAYPHIIRCKGSLKSLYHIEALFNRISIGCISGFEINSATKEVYVRLTQSTIYVPILRDIIELVLPSGYSTIFTVESFANIDGDYVYSKDVIDITPSSDDVQSMYNRVFGIALQETESTKSEFGSKISTTQIINLSQYTNIKEESND